MSPASEHKTAYHQVRYGVGVRGYGSEIGMFQLRGIEVIRVLRAIVTGK